MSRPLSGSIKANPSGTFTASIPVQRGSTKRTSETFRTKREAERWLTLAVTAREAGRPIPRLPAAGPSGPRVAGTRFKTIAEEWVQERYVEDGHGDVDRENQVRTYVNAIDAYMGAHNLRVETVSRQDARKMYRHLLKDSSAPAAAPFPKHENPDARGTMQEAIDFLAEAGFPCSPSTFKRACRSKGLRPVGSCGQAHLYRFGDLFDPQVGLAVGKPADGSSRFAYTTMKDVRRTFRDVLAYAEGEGIAVLPQAREADLPKNTARKPKTRGMTLEEAARIAARLHVVHQIVLWLLRVLGLRISEAYGLLVEDVVDAGLGQPGILTVQSQGGRAFRRRGDDGETVTTDHVDETKSDSWRILVVPAPLMDLLRVVIDVFHTDTDGTTRTEARLVPGLTVEDKSGQGAFRHALANAAHKEGLNMVLEDTKLRSQRGLVTVTPTPQAMRQSFATALQADREVIEAIRAYMGHRRGTEVIHEHYILEDLEMKPQRDIAEAMTKQIASGVPGGLMVQTSVSCTTGRQLALAQRAAEIDAKLGELGWFQELSDDGSWITVAEAADIRGVTPTQIRDDIHAARLAAKPTSRADQAGLCYLVDATDVLEMADARAVGSGIRQLADDLGEPYDKIRQYIRRHPDLQLEECDGRRDHIVSDDVADHVRAYFRAQQELVERAVRLPDAAKELGISVAATKTLIKHGRLIEDDRFHGGVQSVTRASLADFHRRVRRRTPRGH